MFWKFKKKLKWEMLAAPIGVWAWLEFFWNYFCWIKIIFLQSTFCSFFWENHNLYFPWPLSNRLFPPNCRIERLRNVQTKNWNKYFVINPKFCSYRRTSSIEICKLWDYTSVIASLGKDHYSNIKQLMLPNKKKL